MKETLEQPYWWYHSETNSYSEIKTNFYRNIFDDVYMLYVVYMLLKQISSLTVEAWLVFCFKKVSFVEG